MSDKPPVLRVVGHLQPLPPMDGNGAFVTKVLWDDIRGRIADLESENARLRPAEEIEVTPEMAGAGAAELYLYDSADQAASTATDVYRAMERCRRQTRNAALANRDDDGPLTDEQREECRQIALRRFRMMDKGVAG